MSESVQTKDVSDSIGQDGPVGKMVQPLLESSNQVEPVISKIRLEGSADLAHRVHVLSMLIDKAEKKVAHSDTFRQTNMNYAFVLFAGLMAVGMKVHDQLLLRTVVAVSSVVLMSLFCYWDRRWHRTKHGWDHTAKNAYKNLAEMINNPKAPTEVVTYCTDQEKSAERWKSPLPKMFYALLAAAVVFGTVLVWNPSIGW